MNIFPYRVRFTKTGRMRFLSHHDLMRLFERAIRRSGLPFRMTEGYNPRVIMAFPAALGLGIESADEIMEFELTSWVAPRQIETQLGAEMPQGVSILRVEPFHRSRRSFVDFVEYEIALPAGAPDLDGRIRALMDAKEYTVIRASDKGSRPVEIRQYLMDLQCDGTTLLARVRWTDRGTARPDEVLTALGLPGAGGARIRKTYTEVRERE